MTYFSEIMADVIEAPRPAERARSIPAPVNPPLPDPASVDMPTRLRAAFGLDPWMHRADGWTLIGLNADMFGIAIDTRRVQMAWLQDVLDTSTGPIGLFLQGPWHRDMAVDSGIRALLTAAFEGSDLRFISTGHGHHWHDHDADWAPAAQPLGATFLRALSTSSPNFGQTR